MAVASAQNYSAARCAFLAASNEDVLRQKNALEIVQIISQAKSTNVSLILKLLSKPDILNHEEKIRILTMFSNCDYDNLSNGFELIDDYAFLTREDGTSLIEMVSRASSNEKSDCITDYLIYHSLGKKDLFVSKMIADYQSISKLRKAYEYAFSEEANLLEDDNMKDIILQAIIHFKDYKEDGTKLFSCLELFDEETDPTVIRAINEIQNQFLNLPADEQLEFINICNRMLKMPKDAKTRVLTRAKTMLDYSENEIIKSNDYEK